MITKVKLEELPSIEYQCQTDRVNTPARICRCRATPHASPHYSATDDVTMEKYYYFHYPERHTGYSIVQYNKYTFSH